MILVDDADRAIGSAPKLEAHEQGTLHRAFSVFVLDDRERLLLQLRALGKYHSGGRWSNTCCGHPRPGETTVDAARRRLAEEMGVSCGLQEIGCFRYRAELDGGLIEHEVDHVLVGRWSGAPAPDPHEVAAWRWAPHEVVRAEWRAGSPPYTAWFGDALELLERWLATGSKSTRP